MNNNKNTILSIIAFVGTIVFISSLIKRDRQNKKQIKKDIWYVSTRGDIKNDVRKIGGSTRENYLENLRNKYFFKNIKSDDIKNKDSYINSIFNAGKSLGRFEKSRKKKEPIGFVIQTKSSGSNLSYLFSDLDKQKFKSKILELDLNDIDLIEIIYKIDYIRQNKRTQK